MTKIRIQFGVETFFTECQVTEPKELKEKISKLEVEFSKNTNEESTKLTFTKEQLSNL